MATREHTLEFISPNRNVLEIVWSGLLNGDSGDPVEFSEYADRTIQVSGTFGSGGSVLLEGSNNDGEDYFTLNKTTDGTAIVATAAQGVGVLEIVKSIRPRVTAGDGTTSLTVTMIAKKV